MPRVARLFFVASVMAAGACDSNPGNPVALVVVTPDTVVIPLNGTFFLNANVQDANGQSVTRPTSWTSSNAAISVDTAGRVTALAVGQATVTATAEGISGSSDLVIVTIQYASIETGGAHTCGVGQTLGLGLCWGQGTSGQLGDSTQRNSQSPTVVRGGVTFASIAAGGEHSCGLTAAGTPYCWGANGAGQLGDGTLSTRRVATAVGGGLTFTQIASGGNHTCGVTAAGTYCWGENASGQVGDSTVSARRDPTLVKTTQTFTTVVTGDAHSCGLTAGGAAYCWGDNFSGQLGNANFTNQPAPVAVTGNLTFLGIDAGGTHTCGLIVGIAGGVAYCWVTENPASSVTRPSSTRPFRLWSKAAYRSRPA